MRVALLMLCLLLLTPIGFSSETLTPLHSWINRGGGQLIPLTDNRIYSADRPPAWSVDDLWYQLGQPEHRAVLLGIGQPLLELEAPATCSNTIFVASPSRQQVTALSQGRLLKSGGICPKDNDHHQGFTQLWRYDHQQQPHWQAVGQLQQARLLHTATELPDDSVMMIGGIDPVMKRPMDGQSLQLSMLSSVELWQGDQVQQLPPLPVARALHSATRLPDGQILVAGGLGADLKPLQDSWLYRLGDAQWRPGPTLPQAVFDHAALQTTFGLVIAGGRNDHNAPLLQTLLLRDLTQGFEAKAPLMLPVAAGQLAQNLHGDVLFSGGYTANFKPNPLLMRWTGKQWQLVQSQAVPNQQANWSVHAQADGHWMLATMHGAYQLTLPDAKVPAEPRSGSVYPRGNRNFSHVGSTNIELRDGRLLVVGGGMTGIPIATTFSEIVDPRTGRWQTTAPTQAAHLSSEAVRLNDGRVLLYGGISDGMFSGQQPTAHSAELFDPETMRWQTLPHLAFSDNERVEAKLQRDGSVLFVVSSDHNHQQYTKFRALRFDPATEQIQHYQAPASSQSNDPLLPPTTPLPYGAHWLLRDDGSVALVGGTWATYLAEPSCAAALRQAIATAANAQEQSAPLDNNAPLENSASLDDNTQVDESAEDDAPAALLRDQLCPEFADDVTYRWQDGGHNNDHIWLWHIAEQRIEQIPSQLRAATTEPSTSAPPALRPLAFNFYQTPTPLTLSNGDLLFKQVAFGSVQAPPLLRWRQLDLTFEWLPVHPEDIWRESQLIGLIDWHALANGAVLVSDYYLSANSQRWQQLPATEATVDWLGGQDALYAVSFSDSYSAKLSASETLVAPPSSEVLVNSADAPAVTSLSTSTTSASTATPVTPQPQRQWLLNNELPLPILQQTGSSLLALQNGDVLQALKHSQNQLRLQLWHSDSQQWQTIAAPNERLAAAVQWLELPDQQVLLVLQAFVANTNQTELRCYRTATPRNPTWQACGTFAVTDSSAFALAEADDGRPALMVNSQQAHVFDLPTATWQAQVPYQHNGELVTGVAVKLAVPLLSLGDSSSGASLAANALGAKFIEQNPSGRVPKWQWSAAKQQWAYIFMESELGREAVELSDGCWLGLHNNQQQWVLFDPKNGQVRTLPESYPVNNAVFAKRPDDTVLLLGHHSWWRGDYQQWFSASCQGVTALETPASTLQTPTTPTTPSDNTAAPDTTTTSATTAPASSWKTLLVVAAPLFYPSLGVLLLLVVIYRRQTQRDEPNTRLQWAIRLMVVVCLASGYGQKLQRVASTGEISPLSETCISQLQHRLATSDDASSWPAQLAGCIPLEPLPTLDCRLVGTWSQHNELMSQSSYITQFAANGRYTVRDTSGHSVREYQGYWGVWQDKLVWFEKDSVDPFADANPIVSISADTIVIKEQNGSKTTLHRQGAATEGCLNPPHH